MAGGKTKLQEQAISEILVADTHLESGDEVSDVAGYFEEQEEKGKKEKQQEEEEREKEKGEG
jgi:hypothetical protein